MIKGKTKNGFEYEIDPDVFDDWKLLRKIRAIDRGDEGMAVDVAETILGAEQLELLENHIEKENGKVPITIIMAELEEIFETCNPAKN